MTDEPETFADAIAKLRTFGAWHDNDRIDAVVAAHEREVARLRAQLNCDDNLKIARDLDNARDALAAAESDIAELKEALRKIGNDKGTGCVINRCPFANDDSVYCEYCTNSAGEVARAALKKTNY